MPARGPASLGIVLLLLGALSAPAGAASPVVGEVALVRNRVEGRAPEAPDVHLLHER